MAARLDKFLSATEQERVVAAIAKEEQRTSGQIKVHIDERCAHDPLSRAHHVFGHLGMHKTRARNGVLIYVAIADRKYAILGDEGIHVKVGSDFWEAAAAAMRDAFKRGAVGDGLVGAIHEVGAQLAALFPHHSGDGDEISNSISTTLDRKA